MKFHNQQTVIKKLRKLFPCGTYLTISWEYGRTIGKVDRFIFITKGNNPNIRQLQYICQYGVDAADTFWTNHKFGVGTNEVRISTDSEIKFLEKIKEKEMLKFG